MPEIEIDDDVYRLLQGRARPFEDTPNSVLRRILVGLESVEVGPAEADASTAPDTVVDQNMGGDVASLRVSAIGPIEASLSAHHHRPVRLVRAAARTSGGLRQRYLTPSGQIIHLRTRAYDPEKQPFFSFDPEALEEADWMVFGCGGRGIPVAPGAELRGLAPGLYLDSRGYYKPTFVVSNDRCDIYAGGVTRSVRHWRDRFEAIAEAEMELSGARQATMI